jgi:hypothetical protein
MTFFCSIFGLFTMLGVAVRYLWRHPIRGRVRVRGSRAVLRVRGSRAVLMEASN